LRDCTLPVETQAESPFMDAFSHRENKDTQRDALGTAIVVALISAGA